VALAVASALSGALRAPGAPGLGVHLAVDLAEHASSLFTRLTASFPS
jgi:hypothetical protein